MARLHVRGIRCKAWPTKAQCTESRGAGEVHTAQVGGEEARRLFRGQGNLCGEITVGPSRERWREGRRVQKAL